MRNTIVGAERVTTLTRTAEHAVRVTLHLAVSGATPVPAAEAARALGIPSNYLAKTLHALARAGIVESQRGPGGGFRLAADPAELTLAAVVEVVNPPRRVRQCILEAGRCDPSRPCSAHDRWNRVEAEIRGPLEATTVADLIHTQSTNER